jgi:hypothetical protein
MFFDTRRYDQTFSLFDAQFEPDGADYLYRKSMKGAPIRVSAAERDAFVAAVRRIFPRMVWGFVAATVVGIVVLALLSIDRDGEASSLYIYGLVAALVCAFGGLCWWVWNAPARALDRRVAVGPERTRAEARRLALARMTWGQLAAGAGATAFGWWHLVADRDITTGWNRLWLIGGVVLAGLLAWRAVQKWQMEIEGK